MITFLVEGYKDAFRGLGAAVKLFWPLVAFFVLSIVVLMIFGKFNIKSEFSTAPLISMVLLAGMLAFFGYVFIILCQGAVGWHRRLLLNERPSWISAMPSRRTMRYAFPAFLFVVAMWICLMLFILFAGQPMAVWLTARIQGLNLTANPTIEQLDAFRLAAIPVNLAMQAGTIVVVGGVIWVARAWLMAFPHIAVRTDQPTWKQLAQRVELPSGAFAALLVTMFLLSVLGTGYQSFAPMSVQMLPWVASTVSIVSILLSVVNLLCGLSILSIAYREARVHEIPYEKIGDGVQA